MSDVYVVSDTTCFTAPLACDTHNTDASPVVLSCGGDSFPAACLGLLYCM